MASVVLALGLALGVLVFASAARGEPVHEEAVDTAPSGAPYAAGELLVTYKDAASDAAVESLDEEAGGVVEERLPEVDTRVLEFPGVKGEPLRGARESSLARAKAELEEDPAVEGVEYNYLYTASYTPNDPRFGSQWGLRRAGFEGAWNRGRGSGARIAIVDSGVAVGHEDLRGKTVAQRDFRNEDGSVEDPYGHGTHVAGIAAAVTGNRTGVAGSCPGCALLAAKALGSDGVGATSDIAEGVVWSADNGADAINLSLASSARSSVLEDAIEHATRKGAVVLAASGNAGTNEPRYPAALDSVVAVASTNIEDRRASSSSYGGWVDVSAPGVDTLSTVPGGYYGYKSGTSMATAHVSGLAGLLAGEGYGPAAIKKRIRGTAVDLGPRGHDPYYGSGRINANRALP